MKKTNYAFVYVTKDKSDELTMWSEKPHRNAYGTWITNRGSRPLAEETFNLLKAQMYGQHLVTVNDELATPCIIVPVTLFDSIPEMPGITHSPSGDVITLNLEGEKLNSYVECDKRLNSVRDMLVVLCEKVERAMDDMINKNITEEKLSSGKKTQQLAKLAKEANDVIKNMGKCVADANTALTEFHKQFRSAAVGEAVMALYNRIEMVEKQKQNLFNINTNLNQQLKACEEAQVVLARENVELKENIIMYIKENHKDLYKLLKDYNAAPSARAQMNSDAVKFQTDVFANIKKLERQITDIATLRKANAELFKQSRAKCRELSNIIDDCEKAFLKKKAEADEEENED